MLLTFIFCSSAMAEEKIDINKADAKTISQALIGIGEKKAEAIIEYRENSGPFKTIDGLTKVKGIGQKTVAKNRDKIIVSGEEDLADVISGKVSFVEDGDTIILLGKTIRMQGIDAPEFIPTKPEFQQQCEREGKKWECGKESTAFLKKLIGESEVNCFVEALDKYQRILARCKAEKLDLNSEMVREGMAIAYKHYDETYLPEEAEAKKNKKGLWAGEFIDPFMIRRQFKEIDPDWYVKY